MFSHLNCIRFSFILPILLILIVSACDGGGGPVPKVEQDIKIGQFEGGPGFISGLYYETATQKGVTTTSGKYNYIEGEKIKFYLGKYSLPSITATLVITPSSYIPQASDASNPYLANLTRIIQTLDVDSSNGVQLPSSLSENLDTKLAVSLEFYIEVKQFETSPQIAELLLSYSLTLITFDNAITNYQAILDKKITELLSAASTDTASQAGVDCINSTTLLPESSPYPCIPGTGGFSIGDISVKTTIYRSFGLPKPGGRSDNILGSNGYVNNLGRLASVFLNTYDITTFAKDLNVGIINFVTTDPNTDPLNVNGVWEYTELSFDGGYIGSLPYINSAGLKKIQDRCGLPNNSRQIIVPPGTYKWKAKAYNSFWCLRIFKNSTPDDQFYPCPVREVVETPIWNWDGNVVVQAGSCTVMNALGSAGPGVNSAPIAKDVSITDDNGGGDAIVGDVLTGRYLYGDLDGDVEGVTIFRWLRDGIAIIGATNIFYTLVEQDLGTFIEFEVTPIAISGEINGIATLFGIAIGKGLNDYGLILDLEISGYFDVTVVTPSGFKLSTLDTRDITPKSDNCWSSYDYSIPNPYFNIKCEKPIVYGMYAIKIVNITGAIDNPTYEGKYKILVSQEGKLPRTPIAGKIAKTAGSSYSVTIDVKP